MDAIFYNGRVVTMNPDQPETDSFAVFGDRFLDVGGYEELAARKKPDTRLVDLKGRTVIPGLIETHNHLSLFATNLVMVNCSPNENQDIERIKARLAEKAGQTPPGEWVLGYAYDDTLISDKRHLTRQDLDEAAPDHPVHIAHITYHLSYENSRALDIAGIRSDTPQPAGGWIHFDSQGQPSGLLMEPGAMNMVFPHLPKMDAAMFTELIPKAMAIYNSHGITSTHDGALGIMYPGSEVLRGYIQAMRTGRMTTRTYLAVIADFYKQLLDVGLFQGMGDSMLKLGPMKTLQDGSIQGVTAALKQDYLGRSGVKGECLMPQADLDAQIGYFHQMGIQVAVHANGDAAIDSALTAIERAQEKTPRPDARHMVIHCQMASDDHIRKMKDLDVIPSFFPNHTFYWGDRHLNLFLGEDRARRLNPFGSAARVGLRFTLHADTPVTPIDPFFSMHCAVNRKTRNGIVMGPDERLTPYQALKAFTIDAAYCSFEEDIKGSIETGKLADFAILAENLLTVPPERIKDIQVLETVVGGRTVWRAEGDSAQ